MTVLWFIGLKFPFFSFAEPYPFAVFPSLSRDLRATVLSLSLTYCEAFDITRLPPSRNDGNVVLWSETFHSIRKDNMRGFVKRLLALSKN